jgi:hypothetical protein
MHELPIAIRAYTERTKGTKTGGDGPHGQETGWPRHVVVFDTETTIDRAQRLTFGSYRFCQWFEDESHLECLEEGLFHDDELAKTDPEGFDCLQEYVRAHTADVIPGVPDTIQLFSRAEFVEQVLYRLGYKTRTLIVGFNLPFDLSRLAVYCGRAQDRFRGGFSLAFRLYWNSTEQQWKPHPYRPRIRIQHVDSKMAFIEFDKPIEVDEDDLRPADGAPPDPKYSFRGRFLDLRTLTFALTNRGHSLASACEAFGVENPKREAERHGVIDPDYIDYNRRDVLASQQLLEKLRPEYDRHPIGLDPCRAYSPASIAKAYLRAMDLQPPAEQFKGFPPEVLGQAMTAFYGGRAEVRIQKTPVPVVHTDFLSMYPTIQILMDLWGILSAEQLEVVDATEEFQQLLEQVSAEDFFRPEVWQELRGFAAVIPQGDVLPTRAQYDGTEWNVGVNHLTADLPFWYGFPDLVASKLATGRAPRIQRAFRLVPKGRQANLRPVHLRGAVRVDPRRENLFKKVIDERQRIRKNPDLSEVERERIQLFLKILANAGSYGVFVEMNRTPLPSGKSETVSIYGRDGRFDCELDAPEEPGAYCFPPVAALITSGARLMLALLERVVLDQGGTYAFADTDSMAIVANESGGLIPCEGGPYRLPDGSSAIRALSWDAVDAIVKKFEDLNPYDREAVPGSILKVEDVNFDRETGRQKPIHSFAISAKRYALFTVEPEDRPEVVGGGYSEHGLGQFLNPIDPDLEEADWIRSVWQGIVDEVFGGPLFEPDWVDQPAVMRSSVSTPGLRSRFRQINRKKPYAQQVKPFNFLISVTVSSIEWPPEVSKSGGFHLIAPYSSKPSQWLRCDWVDLHSGRRYRIRADQHSGPSAIRVQTFRDVLHRFRNHPESKSAGPDGNTSDSRTSGLLTRLHVRVFTISHIGKETNLIEQQEEGVLTDDPLAVYSTEGEWEVIRSRLRSVKISDLATLSGISPRMIRNLRKGDRRPGRGTRKAITEALVRMLNERAAD